MLLKLINTHKTNWEYKLDPVLFGYRVAKHHSTGDSPFYMLYHREPRLPIDVELFSNDRLEEENADQYKLRDYWMYRTQSGNVP